MIELHPRMMRRLAARDTIAMRGGATLAIATMLRRGRAAWGNEHGCNLLVRWGGERLPLPSLSLENDRPAVIVGVAHSGATDVATWSDVTHAVSTIYHFGVIPVSGGGVLGTINPWTIQHRVFDAAGDLVGLMPNAPAAVSVGSGPGFRPLLRWAYSAFNQQAAPSEFQIFATTGSTFNFASPVSTATYVAGQAHYEWSGSPLTPGDMVHYTVRAATSAGVLSLIPRTGLCPSASYTSADLARCPLLSVPAAISPVSSLAVEVD